jgi:hypothetical protein
MNQGRPEENWVGPDFRYFSYEVAAFTVQALW